MRFNNEKVSRTMVIIASIMFMIGVLFKQTLTVLDILIIFSWGLLSMSRSLITMPPAKYIKAKLKIGKEIKK